VCSASRLKCMTRKTAVDSVSLRVSTVDLLRRRAGKLFRVGCAIRRDGSPWIRQQLSSARCKYPNEESRKIGRGRATVPSTRLLFHWSFGLALQVDTPSEYFGFSGTRELVSGYFGWEGGRALAYCDMPLTSTILSASRDNNCG
jgi:hypothetical protein